jgi:hypothetical protein
MTQNIDRASVTDFKASAVNITVDTKSVDDASGQDETRWQNTKASQQWGYFNKIPQLKSAITAAAVFSVGYGYTTDPETTVILDHIQGNGKENFESILFDLEVQKRIYGDAYAEIIWDKESKLLLNLRILDSSTVTIISNKSGKIIRYEQSTRQGIIKFAPEDILHFSRNRLCGQVHGISDIDALEDTILAEHESFLDCKKLSHQLPLDIWFVPFDDATKLANFRARLTEAKKLSDVIQSMVVPSDDPNIKHEQTQITPSPMLAVWRNEIDNKFFRGLNLPLVLFGQAGNTESGGKIEFEANNLFWVYEKRRIELELWNQLFIKITLNANPSLLQKLQADQAKDTGQMGFQPKEVGI